MIKKVGWDKKLAKEWGKYKPPSRPSSGEIRIYESYIRELPRKSKILIMGSTPELRDLTAKYKIDTTICDWSEDVYRALKLLVKHKAKETFIRGDWREMNFGEKFDMIIGDCSTTVVPYKDLDTVISNVSRNLVPNGLAIQRIWVRHKKEKYSVSKIVKIFKKKPKNMHWYTWMLFTVFLHYYDTKNESLSGADIYEKMNKDYKKGRLPKRLLELFSLVKNHKTPNNVLLKRDLEKMLKMYFRIIKIEYGNDNFRKYAPIYVLENSRQIS